MRRDLLEHYHLEPDTVWVIPLAPMFGVYAAAHDDSASFPQFELPDRFALDPVTDVETQEPCDAPAGAANSQRPRTLRAFARDRSHDEPLRTNAPAADFVT